MEEDSEDDMPVFASETKMLRGEKIDEEYPDVNYNFFNQNYFKIYNNF